MNSFKWFAIQRSGSEITMEESLAQKGAWPPWKVCLLPANTTIKNLLSLFHEKRVGLIFDSQFWFTHSGWEKWANFINEDNATGLIHVPLGNLNYSRIKGCRVLPYLTLRGFERVSEDLFSQFRTEDLVLNSPSELCVAIADKSLLVDVVQDLKIADLPRLWAGEKRKVRVYTGCWMHSFNAIEEAGKRKDLLTMCDWKGHVLELGCGKGLMAKTCKNMGYDVKWLGMDISKKSLDAAVSNLDLAIQADASFLPLNRKFLFDRIVCGDFLEHLPYPWQTLSTLRQLIKPEGFLLVSVPNIGHWLVVEDLLSGRWDETPSGVFCVTHLRFGTKKTWERWLKESGWKIVRIDAEKLCLPETWKESIAKMPINPDTENLENIAFKILARPV